MKTSVFLCMVIAVSACGDDDNATLDSQLRAALGAHRVVPLERGAPEDVSLVALGQALYFDRELSGNRDIACATCHHPTTGTSDDLSLSIGVGGDGLGAERQLADGAAFIPRNAPDVWNRGALGWKNMFWDGRVAGSADGGTPAGGDLPALLADSPLAAQAMFPPTSREEMRGHSGDMDVYGAPNELADIDDDDVVAIWEALITRLLDISEYQAMFEAAFPSVPQHDLGFEHAVVAIAAFESDAFTFTNSPYDRYVAGDNAALSDQQKRGGLLFYGDAGCADCHSGALLTDQEFYNLCTPQVGPGRGDTAPQDVGRYAETQVEADRYRFRTPPLRNVTLSGPWMHDGAYVSLKDAVRHHFDPIASLLSYDKSVLDPRLQDLVVEAPEILAAMTANPATELGRPLTDNELDDLMAFLESLEDSAATNLTHLVPASVPSGLPVDGRD